MKVNISKLLRDLSICVGLFFSELLCEKIFFLIIVKKCPVENSVFNKMANF